MANHIYYILHIHCEIYGKEKNRMGIKIIKIE